jgi:hypothetical protein
MVKNVVVAAMVGYNSIVPQCLSPRWNWDKSTPFPASECAPPPPTKGGGHTRFRMREVGGSQFGRHEKKLSTLSTLCFNLFTRYGISKKALWGRCVHKTFWKLTKEGSANSSVYLLISSRVILLAGLHTNFTSSRKKGPVKLNSQENVMNFCIPKEFEGTVI